MAVLWFEKKDIFDYYIEAISKNLIYDELKHGDRGIIGGYTSGKAKWSKMNQTEKTVFINRVLYEYWMRIEKSKQSFWQFKKNIDAKAQELKTQEENFWSRFSSGSYSNSNFYNQSPKVGLLEAYKVLGVEMFANMTAIKKAYRDLVKKHHPDRGGNKDKFIEIQNAYEMLTKGA